VELLREAVALDPESAPAWEQLGTALFARRDLGAAAEALRQALALEPERGRARHALALVHLAAGEPAAAELELDRFLGAHPDVEDVRLDRATLHCAAARFEAALADIEAVAESPRSRFARAVALDGLGRREEAVEALRALRDDPEAGGYAARAAEVLDGV
jgi:tetratricopeptide (TPR) repeat protein